MKKKKHPPRPCLVRHWTEFPWGEHVNLISNSNFTSIERLFQFSNSANINQSYSHTEKFLKRLFRIPSTPPDKQLIFTRRVSKKMRDNGDFSFMLHKFLYCKIRLLFISYMGEIYTISIRLHRIHRIDKITWWTYWKIHLWLKTINNC